MIILLYPPGLIKYWCPLASCLPLACAIFFIQTVSTFIIHEIKILHRSEIFQVFVFQNVLFIALFEDTEVFCGNLRKLLI